MMSAAEVLGVDVNATDEAIRVAYLNKVREHPPDRSPEEFERIRDAYETLRDPRRRMRDMLFSANPNLPFTEVFGTSKAERQFVGPHLWIEVLKRK